MDTGEVSLNIRLITNQKFIHHEKNNFNCKFGYGCHDHVR